MAITITSIQRAASMLTNDSLLPPASCSIRGYMAVARTQPPYELKFFDREKGESATRL
jgi:hypothetical protein